MKKNQWIILLWIATIVYIISPIDIIPELLYPIVGYTDDLILTLISIYLTKKVGGKK